MQNKNFEERLRQHTGEFARVVPFTERDKLLLMDFTSANEKLADEVVRDTNQFIRYINGKLSGAGAKYGIGGYGENRAIYRRSELFDTDGPSRPSRREGHQPHKISPVNDSTVGAVSLQSKALCSGLLPGGEAGGAVSPHPEEEKQRDIYHKQEKIGFEHADPFLYGMLKEYALQNRGTPTQAEEVLWNALKTKQLGAYKFRRQHIIDKFITDFVCLKKRLVVEVDGLIHQLPENKESDEYRTNILNELGFTVIRFTNDEVLYQSESVLTKILVALEQSIAVSQPAPSDRSEANEESPQSKGLCKDGLPGGKVGMGRTLHLGTDIWGAPYTKVIAPLNGIVHSFAFNNAYGDYGATIVLTHNLEGESFHTLYGHLSLNSIKNLHEGDAVYKGDVIAEFGIPFENGQWPPHLHFQIIKDMQGMKGDYPGVCALGEKEMYLDNCPDADLILGMMNFAAKS